MGKLGLGCAALLLAVGVGTLASPPAGAAGCASGPYRAGCAGPNGAVGVRKSPGYPGGVYRGGVYRPVPVYRPPVYRQPVYPPPVYRPPVVVVPPPRPIVMVPP